MTVGDTVKKIPLKIKILSQEVECQVSRIHKIIDTTTLESHHRSSGAQRPRAHQNRRAGHARAARQHADGVELVRMPQAGHFVVRGHLPGAASATSIQINATGSENGFRDLAEGTCDIGMSSRRITASEVGQLSRLGNMTSPTCEHVIGLDGVAFIVNRRNPVRSLTTDQLVGLLTCRLRNWAQVGGLSAPVKLIRRNDESGTYKTVRDLLLGGDGICADADVIADSRELSARVASDANAIGFIGLPYVGAHRALALGDGATPPLVPDPITVGTEEYTLARRLYLYTADRPLNDWVRKFVEFASSEQHDFGCGWAKRCSDTGKMGR